MKNTHTQCTLRRGSIVQHAWIPSEYAQTGKYVKLLDEDGWLVENTGAVSDSDYVKTHSYDYKTAFASLQKG
jgi:hypothetical protein